MEHALTMILTALVLYLFSRDLRKPAERTSDGSIILSYGPVLKFTAWIVGLLPLALLVSALLFPREELLADPLFWTLLLIISALAGWMVMAVFGQRILASSTGLQSEVLNHEKARFSWAEVECVSYSTLSGGLTFHASNGQKLRISRFRRGVDELPSLLRHHVSPTLWEDAMLKFELHRHIF